MRSDKEYLKQRIIEMMTLPPEQKITIENRNRLSTYALHCIIALSFFCLGLALETKPRLEEHFIVDEQRLIDNWPYQHASMKTVSFPELPEIEVIYVET